MDSNYVDLTVEESIEGIEIASEASSSCERLFSEERSGRDSTWHGGIMQSTIHCLCTQISSSR